MKSIRVLVMLLVLFTSLTAAAQSGKTYDKVFFLNGEVKEGKVVQLSDSDISFSFKGESLVYQYKKTAVNKIEFASGRIEYITAKPSEKAPRQTEAENKVAVIPMSFLGDGNETRMGEMKYRLQEMTVEYLQKAARELKVQDPATTNALLRKKGIGDLDIRTFTPQELAAILEVEYVIMGTVNQEKGNTSTTTNSTTQGNRKLEGKNNGVEIKEKETTSGYSNTQQSIQTDVSIAIYNDKGEKIYTKSRHSILSTPEAYKNTLQYLLKRTPLYKR